MKLWLITRAEDKGDKSTPIYDCYDGHVIAAPTEVAAREMASAHPGDEGAACWLSGTTSRCGHIGESLDDVPGIVLSDFHAG